MTTKDLNLSLDPSLVQTSGKPRAQSEVKPYSGEYRESKKTASSNYATPKTVSPWRTAFAVAITVGLANILFLGGAGYWLLQSDYVGGMQASPQPSQTSQAVTLKLNDLDAKLKMLLAQNEHQRVASDQHQQIILSSQQAVAEHLALLTPEADALPKNDARTPPPVLWNVNLGSFQSEKAALTVQRKGQAAGFKPAIITSTSDNITTHKVAIIGLADRDSAESVAKSLMDNTNLDSLWVWKDD